MVLQHLVNSADSAQLTLQLMPIGLKHLHHHVVGQILEEHQHSVSQGVGREECFSQVQLLSALMVQPCTGHLKRQGVPIVKKKKTESLIVTQVRNEKGASAR